jgi:hypothetical protein
MLSVHVTQIERGADALRRPPLRYGVLARMAASARARDVRILAFGLGERELRVVLEGDPAECLNVLRGTKGGTARAARAWDAWVYWGDTERHELTEAGLIDAVVACHAVGPHADPLENPWTSHRDLLGFRRADFFDPRPLRERVDPRAVHRLAGGGALPDPTLPVAETTLERALRVSAAVLGVPPAHRRCFRLFVHLGRTLGFGTPELASALMLTGRRIRQLHADDEPLLPLALAHLADGRLAQVP